MPLGHAIAVGLILHGTTTISLADGSTSFRLTAKGMVTVGTEKQVGVVILEPDSTEVLLGMAFLRLFKRALLVSELVVGLIDEEEVKKVAAPASAASQDPGEHPPPEAEKSATTQS